MRSEIIQNLTKNSMNLVAVPNSSIKAGVWIVEGDEWVEYGDRYRGGMCKRIWSLFLKLFFSDVHYFIYL